MRQGPVEGGPRADVVPRKIGTRHHDPPRVLHERVIDRNVFQLLEDLVDAEIVAGVHRLGHAANRVRQRRTDPVQLIEKIRDAPAEHAAVPEVAARGDKVFRDLAVGFFVEGAHRIDGDFPCRQWRGSGRDLNIAVARLGPGRHYAERCQDAFPFHDVQGGRDGFLEAFRMPDVVVRRGDGHGDILGGLVVTRQHAGGRVGQRAGGIAFARFRDDVFPRHARVGVADRLHQMAPRHHVDILRCDHGRDARNGFREKGLSGRGQTEQLFRPQSPGQRPEPLAASSGHDYGDSDRLGGTHHVLLGYRDHLTQTRSGRQDDPARP
ncbi:MAG: hypothetical protein BWY59_00882 [Verrucomicrobia bacterium ADurb.Bin345]|nr:MAG: hypothetical protein BWY59_00882 [Verrucomicrobia bacterium ADurb.Bin345]